MTTARVRVPATSANLGPGFDSFGLALTLYNEIAIHSHDGKRLDVTVHSADAGSLSTGKDNIAWVAAHRLLSHLGHADAAFRLEMRNEIPLSRGLGSSAAARAGALVAANEWARRQGWTPATTDELLNLATELEGHPDNAAAALLGGFTVSAVGESESIDTHNEGAGRAWAIQSPVTEFPQFLVFSPDGELATKKARAVLPQTVSHRDAVFNLSRSALLLAALATGKLEALPEAMKDRLHQNQRATLVPGWSEIGAAATSAGAYGMTLSGAGSSMLIWLPPRNNEILKSAQAAILLAAATADVSGTLRALDVDMEGAIILPDTVGE